MRYIDADGTREGMEKAFDRLYRRVRAIETDPNTTIRTSAPTHPILGDMWLEVSTGYLKVWNGSTWNNYQKV